MPLPVVGVLASLTVPRADFESGVFGCQAFGSDPAYLGAGGCPWPVTSFTSCTPSFTGQVGKKVGVGR